MKVVIAEESLCISHKLITMLSPFDGVSVINIISKPEEVLEKVISHQANLLVLNYNFCGYECISAIRRIKSACPNTIIILMTETNSLNLEIEGNIIEVNSNGLSEGINRIVKACQLLLEQSMKNKFPPEKKWCFFRLTMPDIFYVVPQIVYKQTINNPQNYVHPAIV